MNKNKLRNLLDILSPDGTSVDFTAFDENVAKLKEGLKQKIEATTLGEMNRQLEKLKKSLDFAPLFKSIEEIEKTLDEKIKQTSILVNNELGNLRTSLQHGDSALSSTVSELRKELESLKVQRMEIATLRERLNTIPDVRQSIETAVAKIQIAMEEDEKHDEKEMEDMMQKCKEEVNKLRTELMSRMNNLPHGGNANRDIKIGGVSVLDLFTDINLKAGTNVTISYSKNQTTKYTDITFAATGGSGWTIETPTGTADGVNTAFTVTATPKCVIIDGITYFENDGYTLAVLTITTTVPPTGFI